MFWIEIALMVAISIRFARGASKLRSFLNLVNTKTPGSKGGEVPADLEWSLRNGAGRASLINEAVCLLQIYAVCLLHIYVVAKPGRRNSLSRLLFNIMINTGARSMHAGAAEIPLE